MHRTDGVKRHAWLWPFLIGFVVIDRGNETQTAGFRCRSSGVSTCASQLAQSSSQDSPAAFGLAQEERCAA